MIEVLESLSQVRHRWERSVVAIGNFDGVHIGHQAIFSQVVDEARARGAAAVALTFEPHPVEYFRPEDAPARLSPGTHRFELMARHGLDGVVCLRFDEDLAGSSPGHFVEEILVRGLKVEHVVVGEDFRFGKGRAGDTESLKELGQPLGMTRTVAEAVTFDGAVVSSTRIRRAIENGQLSSARAMLGRPHRLSGTVVPGEERGRKLGFPTANMEVVDMAIPPVGVYATTLARSGGEHWLAVTNIGHRPTFGGGELTVETFVLEEGVKEDLDLYGDEVELDVYVRIRGEIEFESPEELVAQIEHDIAEVRRLYEEGELGDGHR